MTLRDALRAGVDALNLSLPDGAHERLLAYLALVEKWNRVYNLTAVREPEKMLTQHVLDSLAVVPHLAGRTVLDVGSGAGLPGIPIALARPDWRVTLLESNHKKSTFLEQARIELALTDVEVASARVEAWAAPQRYDAVISRAFSDLAEFVKLAGQHCSDEGVLAAMKGVYPYEELAQLPETHELTAVIALTVPGLEAERHLVLMRRR